MYDGVIVWKRVGKSLGLLETSLFISGASMVTSFLACSALFFFAGIILVMSVYPLNTQEILSPLAETIARSTHPDLMKNGRVNSVAA